MRKRRIGISHKKLSDEEFEDLIKFNLTHRERESIMRAYRFAQFGHLTQQRYDESEYFDHCKETSLIYMLEFRIFKASGIIASLLHDIKEESFILKWHDIEYIFKAKECLAIRTVTKEKGKDYFFGLENAVWWVLAVKFADRLHNVRTLKGTTQRHIRKVLKETKEIFFPLLDILAGKVPKKYNYLPGYIREELLYAIKRAEKFLA